MNKLILSVVSAAMLLIGAPSLKAQAPGMQIPAAPVDSAVIKGKLDNGMTYYIRHNENPKGQADFFIAQKVGSILEKEEQRGLAHFLEHMCFNGTQNFPGNSLIDWLETVGVKFGYNLNAYTGLDETVYNISSVPVARKGVIDSCLLILHDWADGLLLDPKEIDKERGVIHEEWRRTNTGQSKIMEQVLPNIYPNSPYGSRLPIGLMSVVDNFKPQVLRDYYETWYRPDNQAIIVVGDIDPAYIESEIKKIFSPIKMPANPQERVYAPVPDNQGTLYGIGHDKEMNQAVALICFKQPEQFIPRQYRDTPLYYSTEFVTYAISNMLNQRLADMAKKADCPFTAASVSLDEFLLAPTKDALNLEVVGKDNDILPGIKAAYREVLRAIRGGFTPSEFDRVKAEYLADYEKQYEQRSGRENEQFARAYAANFTRLNPIPGIEYEYNLTKQIAEAVPLAAINQMLPELIKDDNRAVLIMLPDTYKLPTDAEVGELMKAVEAEDIEAFKEVSKTEPLVASLPQAQQPKVSENAQWKATELKYGNGATVIITPTAFPKGQIVLAATAQGLQDHLDSDPAVLKLLPYYASVLSLGTYNPSDLEKYLSGKQTQLSLSFDSDYREMDGSTTPKNLKTLMELIYMYFTGTSLGEEDYNGLSAKLKSQLANILKNPQVVWQAGMTKNRYKAAALQFPTVKDVETANREEAEQIIRDMFSNPGDFTFVFVGDVNVEELTKLCDTYIGSIAAPRIAGIPAKHNPDYEPITGANTVVDYMEMTEPQVWTAITMSAKVPYSAKEKLTSSMAGQILSNRLLKKIREEMGATYSIGAGASLSRVNDQNLTLIIPFPMNPDREAEVMQAIQDMINDMAKNVADEEFQPIQEYMVKQAIEDSERNETWSSAMTATMLNGVDTFNGVVDQIKSITKQDIINMMKQLVDANNYRVYLLKPEAKK